MTFTKIHIAILLFIILATASFFVLSQDEVGPQTMVSIKTYEPTDATDDTDGDGVPDWLEVISGTDPDDKTFFPYATDIEEKQQQAGQLTYTAPQKLAEQIVTRHIEQQGGPITEEEKNTIIKGTIDHLQKTTEERGFPSVIITADETVDRRAVLTAYTEALTILADKERLPIAIDSVVVDVLIDQTDARKKTQPALTVCEEVLTTLPKSVPPEVLADYTLFFNRMLYLCEMLEVVRGTRPEDVFYLFSLLNEIIRIDQQIGVPLDTFLLNIADSIAGNQ